MTREDARELAGALYRLDRAGRQLQDKPRPNSLRAYLCALEQHDAIVARLREKIAAAAREAG